MKNSSKKNSDFGYYSKNTNHSERNNRFLNDSAKNKKVENLKQTEENNTFSSSKKTHMLVISQKTQIVQKKMINNLTILLKIRSSKI